ncbi:ATP-binding protein [Shimazuella alba]|uniref:DUF87 domain-containing protein n=1 Tax=Shimazuella alba TaxID=2690964 RepID=A0A6I4VYZ6_9BACL|nr:DUF87 domain-containing protein [Shimazuella alba]MXQ54966.1 DUF87 domain-containing protein [Shimazuella alba]
MNKVLEGLDESLSIFGGFKSFFRKNPDSLVGYVMDLGYEEGVVITNDFYKLRNQGIPKNSFVIIKLIDTNVNVIDRNTNKSIGVPEHYILARVKEPTATPLSSDVSRTYFELHKSHMPEIDIFTKAELQWSALKIAVLGTYYENEEGNLEFAGDIESYFSPHLYEVYRPSNEILDNIINSSIQKNIFNIGKLRYTESKLYKSVDVKVNVSVDDFIGSRTALFGKTRMGKSNTVKIIAESIITNQDNDKTVGQIIFDMNGEYANKNGQDDTSLYEKYNSKCTRYSVNKKAGMETLKANMYEDLKLGHEIIKQMLLEENVKADYINGFTSFELQDDQEQEDIKNRSYGDYKRYRRHESIYKCILKKAKFECGDKYKVYFDINSQILSTVFGENFKLQGKYIPIGDAISYYSKIWDTYVDLKGKGPFIKKNKDKESIEKPYFDETDISLLSILTGKKHSGSNVSGITKIMKYSDYHDYSANNALYKMLDDIYKEKTVILDLSNSNPVISRFFTEKLCNTIFSEQMELFTENNLNGRYVQMYFEEAHNIFPSNDNDMSNIYNRLAKEGAKLNIGLIYSTQSISTLSRDLLKNTENFFIAHLNDQNEIKELTKFYEFKDVGLDVQKTKSKGFVRLVTQSHKYALPVQIKKFEV